MTGSFMGRGNQYTQLVKVPYCKLLTINKQLPTFPHGVPGLNCRPQRWEVSVTTVPPWSQQMFNTPSLIAWWLPNFASNHRLSPLCNFDS